MSDKDLTDLVSAGAQVIDLQQAARELRPDVDGLRAELRQLDDEAQWMGERRQLIESALIAEEPPPEGVASIADEADGLWHYMSGVWRGDIEFPVIETGWPALTDALNGGWVCSGINVIAARPGVGKTCMAEQECMYHAHNGNGVAFVTLELERWRLLMRMALREAGLAWLGHRALDPNTITPAQRQRISSALETIRELPVEVIGKGTKRNGKRQSSPQTWKEIEGALDSVVSRWRYREPLRLVVIDWLFRISTRGARGSKEERYTDVIDAIDDWAEDHEDIAVILVHGLRRPERPQYHKPGWIPPRPTMADLHSVGQLEYAAEVIVHPHRPEKATEGAEDAGIERCEQVIGKVRGAPGVIAVPQFWDPRLVGFVDDETADYGRFMP